MWLPLLHTFSRNDTLAGIMRGDHDNTRIMAGDSQEELVPVTSSPLPAGDAPAVETSVVVVAGEKDDEAYEGLTRWAEQLKDAGLKNLTTATWPGDHRMPPKGEKVYDQALRALGLLR